jgi:lipopolysaccharide transport system permease protein
VSRGRLALDERAEEPSIEASKSMPAVGAIAPAVTTEDARAGRVTVIRPAPRWPHLDVRELWHYRELLVRLTWRDVAVKYKQTAIGIAWAVLQPFLMTIVFTLVFGKFANFYSKGVPYPIFSYSANLVWVYFAASVGVASASIVANRSLVTKVYFPRVLLPLAGITVPLVDMLFAFSVLVIMWFWFGVWPSPAIVLAPFFVLMAAVTALGVGLFLGAVTVRYRDVPYAIPFVMQSWMFVSGVIQPISRFPEYAQWVLAFNPMTAVINGFQWGVIGTAPPDLTKTMISLAMTVVFFVIGLSYFRRSEPKFADTI